MKRLLVAIALLLCIAIVPVLGQVSEPDPSLINIDTAQISLKEVSVNKFEDAAFWTVRISLDDGIATSRLFAGGPNEENGKQPLADDQEPDGNVLGVRVDYFRRGNTLISVAPVRPLVVPGITKTVSVWVAGRNYNHVLNVRVRDFIGREFSIPMGTLNFSGWKKLTIAVPPSVEQVHPHYPERQGIQIVGFTIDPALTETYGSYYVYFDDLRVWTDLFSQDAGTNPNDLPDNW